MVLPPPALNCAITERYSKKFFEFVNSLQHLYQSKDHYFIHSTGVYAVTNVMAWFLGIHKDRQYPIISTHNICGWKKPIQN